MLDLNDLLELSSARRDHIYPRQVLGVRMAMPIDKLLVVQAIDLVVSIQAKISREDAKAYCHQCGEEIFNEREVRFQDKILCRSCSGQAYYDALLNPEVQWGVLESISKEAVCKFP